MNLAFNILYAINRTQIIKTIETLGFDFRALSIGSGFIRIGRGGLTVCVSGGW